MHCNTENFIKNLNSHNISCILTRYFDEMMVLYNLIGNREDLDIRANDDCSSLEFVLTANSKEDAYRIYNALNKTSFSVYNSIYNISMEIFENSISTFITKADS